MYHQVNLRLSEFQISTIPTAFYVPNYISAEEEAELLRKIYDSPKIKWRSVNGRRLQNWGGIPHPKGMLSVPLPSWLEQLGRRMAFEDGIFDGELPNHVLVNEYSLPNGGIMPHVDGPLYKPNFAILSLESAIVMDIYKNVEDKSYSSQSFMDGNDAKNHDSVIVPERPVFSILLEPRSLLVIKDELYTSYRHGIAFRDMDIVSPDVVNHMKIGLGTVIERKRRVSLTLRVVEKVLVNMIRIGS